MTARACRIAAVCIAALLLAGCGQEDRPDQAAEAKKPALLADKTWPNVVLISVDSLRPDHLHCYGYPKNTSPRIDQLASEGALFESVISSSAWTLPAHATMFTGLADSVHGCTDSGRRLDDKYYTLAERLKDTGYATVGFFAGPYLHPIFGLDQGFDEYIDCTFYPQPGEGFEDPRIRGSEGTAAETLHPATLASSNPGILESSMERDITNPQVLAAVQSWLRESTRRPFFMFVHLWDVHFDFIPPPPYDTRFDPDHTGEVSGERFLRDPKINKDMPERDLEHLLALYDGEIAWTDEHVGGILDELDALELLDGTIVVLTADHGTAFFEHNLKGHRNALFDEVIRIPLVVRYPAAVPAGQRHRQQARMIDLVPTILDLLGVRWSQRRLMGQSLAPLFAGQKTERDEPAISELSSWGHELQAFRRPERKTIWNLATDKVGVFDLRVDPGELAALSDREAPTVRAARVDVRWSRDFLEAFRRRYAPSPRNAGLPTELLEKLRSLGYEDDAWPAGPASAPAP